MRRLGKGIRKLLDSTSGTAVIETAIVAPVLAIVIMGIVDVANYGSSKLKVQQAVNRGLEMAMIGGPTTSTETIEDQVEAQAGIPDGQVSVTQSQKCNDADATWGSSCTSGQDLRRFIHITATASFRPNFLTGALAQSQTLVNGRVSTSTTGVIRVQ